MESEGSAAQERAAIVAWLRAQAREGGEVADNMQEGPNRRAMVTAASTYATAADLIEEAAHHAV